jgi:hypothetical protein
MKIATDIDGVLIDIVPEMTRAARLVCGRAAEDLNWTLCTGGMTEAEIAKVNDFVLTRLDPRPYLEAIQILREWAREHELFYITARRSLQDAQQVSRLIQNKTRVIMDIHFPPGELIFTGDDKVEACCQAGVDLMVEDRLESAAAIDPLVPCYLIDRPWNRHGTYHRRVSSLRDVVKRVSA